MKLTIESTEQICDIQPDGIGMVTNRPVQGRVWIGTTESGIPVQVLVTRIAVAEAERQEEFQRALSTQHAPSPVPWVFSPRMFV